MKTQTRSILENRVTTGRFDPSFAVSEKQIRNLVRLATQAPSAFILQNWKFIAIESPKAKMLLKSVSYDQQQIADAGVTIIVSGVLNAHHSLFRTLQPSVDAGALPDSLQRAWSEMAAASHENNPQLQRDEALRSASLAAMAMLVAAREMELDSGVIGGFDPDGVSTAFNLSPDELPVMLVTVGRTVGQPRPQKVRKPVSEVLTIR